MSPKTSILLILIFAFLFFFRLQTVPALYQPDPNSEFQGLTKPLSPFRDYLNAQIKSALPSTQASLLSGILLGIKSDLPVDLKKALINTSTIHIVVVSGQNLSLVAGFMMALSPIFGRRPIIFISLLGIFLYSLLTGFQLPVIRAAIMSTLLLISQLFGRDRDGGWLLAIAAWAMLMYNPNWLLSISFQLSFMATLGALVVSKTVAQHLNFLPEVVKQDAAVSLCAQALTLPIIAANFHQISLIGIFANLFVLWTVGPIMITGLVTLIGSMIFPSFGWLLALVPYTLLTYFVYVVTFFSQVPFASLQTTNWSTYLSLGFYILIFGGYLHLYHNCKASSPGHPEASSEGSI